MGSLFIPDFSGGLNLRDSPNEIALNETASAFNWTLDELGALKRRRSNAVAVSLPGVSGKKADIFYSAALDLWLCARETSHAPNTLCLHSRPGDLSGSWTDRGVLNSVVTARAAFVDFPGTTPKVVITTDVNSGATKGVFTFDGAFALTSVSTTVAGNAITLWQDRAIVGGYPTSDANGTPPSIFACAPKDPATWTTAGGGWTQQLREKDAAVVTGLSVASGALIAFKKRSTYRINDSSSGSYQTIDSSAGCVNPRAVVPLYGRLYTWGAASIYECDGVGPLVNVGDKLRPWFIDANTDQTTICGGAFNDNVIFAGTVAGPQRVVEFSPRNRWAVPHLLPSGNEGLSSFSAKEATLYGAASGLNDLYTMFTATPADDAEWNTPWFLPNSGMMSRLHRLRVQGLSAITGGTRPVVSVYKDWNPNVGAQTFNISTDLLDSGSGEVQRSADIQSLGHGAAFAFDIIAAGSGAVSIRALQLIDQLMQWPNPGYPKHQAGTATRGRGSGGPPPLPLPPPAP